MSGSGTLCRSVHCQKTCSRLIEVSVQRSVQGTQVRKGEGAMQGSAACARRTLRRANVERFSPVEAFAVGAVLNIGGETCSFN